MDVRLEGVGDEHAKARGGGEICLDLPIGIDEKRDAGIGIRDEIARVPQAGVKELLYQQLARTLARVLLRSRLLADRLGFLLQHLFARAEIFFLRCDHGRYPLVNALALCLCLFE